MQDKFKLKLGDKELSVEVCSLVGQANGSVLVRYGDTVVLATAVMSKNERTDIDYFPLFVDYEEKYYAAGKILGSRYMKRESRPSEEAILTARLIDRAIRPQFPENLKKEIQITVTCLSWDAENDADILGLIGASCALSISDIPWKGPIAVARVAEKLEGKGFILNPTYEQREQSDLDFLVASAPNEKSEDVLINMIEAGGKEQQENAIIDAVKFAKPELKKIINFQQEIKQKVGKEKVSFEIIEQDNELENEIKEFLGNQLQDAFFSKNKNSGKLDEIQQDLVYFIEGKYPAMGKTKYVKSFLEKEINMLLHKSILESEKRPDNRKIDEVREIRAEVNYLPRTHGTGVFHRGETKSLSILTLGSPGDQKVLEGMEINGKKRFMHHYNFPAFSVGEVRPNRGPSRRDIGHGMLAEKALMPLLPDVEEFPYTIRIVSEILSSNGSSSMASISSASLALMDAGVPIKRPVTGIAMGLIKQENGEKYKILTDIQGPEDHYGDMDLKVAGTKRGITAIQMDVKIEGISEEIFKQALKGAKDARLQILEKIGKTLAEPRKQLSQYAPRILTLQINPDKIREVVGPGGKMINEIIDECGVAIDIEQSGLIYITSDSGESAERALDWIKGITREVKVGEIFQGEVKRILNFGAFVEVLPKQEGLVHISQLSHDRVDKVEDVVKIGDKVSVKVISIDEQGRINLSMKDVKK